MDDIKVLFNSWVSDRCNIKRDTLFEKIWITYHGKLQVYLSGFYNSDLDLKDMVSDILMNVFENIHKYNSKYAFSTWIYMIARNYKIDVLRKKNYIFESLDDYHISDDETPENLLIKEGDKHLIKDAISRLKSSDREIVYLSFYEELKYKEISKITGMPVGTIKYRMSEIKKELNKDLIRSFNNVVKI